jgi:F-type H+-transporting ATPase subunit b
VQIDLFTVVAQIVNFLIVAYLLKRFLYDRVVRAMDERRETIESRLSEAREEKERAEERARALEEKERELDEERDEILESARRDAEERRKELLGEARGEIDERKARWKRALADERDSFLSSLREAASKETLAIARKAVAELADADVGERAAERFLERLREAEDDEVDGLIEAASGADGGVRAVSGTELGDALRERIAEAVRERVDGDLEVTFDTDEDLILGIELRAGGRRIGWTAQGYLDDLEARLRERVDREAAEKEST